MCSSVSTEQSCADGTPLSARSPSLFQLNTRSERSSPARFKVYPQSESCGSSPASGSMELDYEMFPTVPMDTRRRILLALYNTKFAKRGDDQWRATDPSVLTKVQGFLKVVDTYLTIDEWHRQTHGVPFYEHDQDHISEEEPEARDPFIYTGATDPPPSPPSPPTPDMGTFIFGDPSGTHGGPWAIGGSLFGAWCQKGGE